jgi:hypothetical protein
VTSRAARAIPSTPSLIVPETWLSTAGELFESQVSAGKRLPSLCNRLAGTESAFGHIGLLTLRGTHAEGGMSLVNVLARASVFGFRQVGLNSDADPGLAFMLAQQKTTQLQFDADRLDATAEAGLETDPVVAEAELCVRQIGALQERIAPLANYVDIAVRFEAQEILAALEAVNTRMERLIRRLQPELPWRDPRLLLEELRSRTH